MRHRFWFAALPALMLGLAACDEQSGQNTPSKPPPAAAQSSTVPAPTAQPTVNSPGTPGPAGSATGANPAMPGGTQPESGAQQ